MIQVLCDFLNRLNEFNMENDSWGRRALPEQAFHWNCFSSSLFQAQSRRLDHTAAVT